METEIGGNVLHSGCDLETTLRTFKRRPRSTEFQKLSTIPTAVAPTTVDIHSLATHPSAAATEPPTKRLKQSSGPSKQPKQLVQVHLDLGQKNFHSTRCPTCGLIYTPGKDSDDRLHAAYHNKLAAAPRYTASRTDTTVATDGNTGEIVRLSTTPPTKSLKDLVAILEIELGLVPGWLLAVSGTVFLYIDKKSRNILGCLVAENITEGWKASASSHTKESIQLKATLDRNDANISDTPGSINNNFSPTGSGSKSGSPTSPVNFVDSTTIRKRGIVLVDKEATEKVRHGIRMMWTSSQARRKNIATKLLDCARCQLVRGYVVPRGKLAFSQPTSDGAAFIKAYSGSNEFLVYDAKSTT